MSGEDAEAYRKWCEERQRATQEQQQQKELLEMWEKQEAERKMEVRCGRNMGEGGRQR